MNGLLGVGLFAVIVGVGLLYYGLKDKVSADTQWGRFSGSVGAVAVIIGIVLMAFGVL